MSFGGMLATAFAGGAQQIGEIAKGDVQNQQRIDLAKEQAAIEEQMRLRLAEAGSSLAIRQADTMRANEFSFNNDPTNVAKRQATAASDTIAKGAAERANAKASLSDTELNNLQRKKATDDALAAGEAERAGVKAKAGDKAYLAGLETVKLADPEVREKIAQMRAAANASNASASNSAAHAGLLRAQTTGVKLSNAEAQNLAHVFDQMDAVNSDPKLDGATRAKKLGELQQRVTLIQGRGGKSGSDGQFDTVTTTEKRMLPDGTEVETKVQGKRPQGSTNSPAQSRGAPPIGTEVDGHVFRGGNPNDKKNWEPKEGSKPAAQVKPQARFEPKYREASDGSGRMVDLNTGRTMTPEQSAVLQKIERGEPTTPSELALLKN